MSNTIYHADFSNTLPEMLANDATMKALGRVVSGELHHLMQNLEQVLIFTRLDELSEEVLDILAYDFKVDWWSYEYTLEEKRKTLRDSWNVHRHLGTKYAVQTAISAIYSDTQVAEWFEYEGEPYHFKLLIDVMYQGVDPKKHLQVLERVEYYKNLRSKLEGVEYTATPEGVANIYVGVAPMGIELEILTEVRVDGLE